MMPKLKKQPALRAVGPIRPAVQAPMAQGMVQGRSICNAAFWRNEPEVSGSWFWRNEPEPFGGRTRDRTARRNVQIGDAITNPATPLQCVEIVQETGRSGEI